jgi:hypothetical protein
LQHGGERPVDVDRKRLDQFGRRYFERAHEPDPVATDAGLPCEVEEHRHTGIDGM